MSTDRTLAKKAAQVYAKALLQASEAKGNVFELSGQLDEVSHTIQGTVELRNTLADHALPLDARLAIIKELFADYDEALLAVLSVVVERGDIALLPRVSEAYLSAAETALGAVIIDVVTVVELDDALRDSIKEKYSAELGSNVILREHIDKKIVGGIVLSTHGRRIDASVVSQLAHARVVLGKRQ
jgi:F-type H+-transporting ATPase subunit delta